MFLPLTGRPSRGPQRVRSLASAVFASIGVRIDWRERDSCPVGVGAIQVRLSYDSTSMRHDRAERGTKRNQDMTTFTIDNQHSLTVLDPPQMHAPLTLIETLPPLACLHCASTQATCGGTAQSPTPYWATPATAYAATRRPATPAPGAAARIWSMKPTTSAPIRKPATRTRASTTAAWTAALTGDLDDTAAALVILAQPARKPMTSAISAAQSAGSGVTSGSNQDLSGSWIGIRALICPVPAIARWHAWNGIKDAQ
jgi:hypothetical protein